MSVVILAGYLIARPVRHPARAAAASTRGTCSPRASRSTSRRWRRSCCGCRGATSGGRCTASARRSTCSRSRVLCEGFAKALAGRANTTLNLLMFGGSFATQWGIGVVVDLVRAALGGRQCGRPRASRSRSCSSPTSLAYAWFVLRLAAARGPARPLRGLTAPHPAPILRHAPAHPRHLRHLHGRHRGDREDRRPPRHRLRRQRLSADEHAARARSASSSPRAGTRRSSTGVARGRRRVRRRQRRVARQSADGGDPRRGPAVRVGAAVAVRERAAPTSWVLAVAGTHGKTTTTAMLAWILEHAGLDPGFLIGGVPLDFDVSARLTDSAVLRDRGRRVRHRVLRQALEVRPLPAAHGDPQQPRVRPRRHLPRPRRDRDAVPPPGAHGAAAGAARRQRRRGEPRARARARLLERGRALRPRRGARHRPRLDDRRRRHDPAGRRAAGHAARSARRGGTTS